VKSPNAVAGVTDPWVGSGLRGDIRVQRERIAFRFRRDARAEAFHRHDRPLRGVPAGRCTHQLGILDGAFHIIDPTPRRTRALIFASDAKASWHVARGVEEKGTALGVGFSDTSGFGSETDAPVVFVKRGRTYTP
jgi:hypothetical protein